MVATSPHEAINAAAVDALGGERFDWRFKAVPASAHAATVADVRAARLPLAGFGTPLLTLDAGARGITVANLPQLRVARAFGVRRVMLANALLDPAGLAWLAAEQRPVVVDLVRTWF